MFSSLLKLTEPKKAEPDFGSFSTIFNSCSQARAPPFSKAAA